MDNNNFLIPANSKKSQMILSFFRPIDLAIFITGVSITILLLVIIDSNDMKVMFMLLAPALIATFLVAPVPYYHNVMTLMGNIYTFYTGRKKYYWRGWCARYADDRESKQQQRN